MVSKFFLDTNLLKPKAPIPFLGMPTNAECNPTTEIKDMDGEEIDQNSDSEKYLSDSNSDSDSYYSKKSNKYADSSIMDYITDIQKDSEMATENETSNESISNINSERRKDEFVKEHNTDTHEERNRYDLHEKRSNSEYADDNDDEVVEITEIREITHWDNKVSNESVNDGNKNNDISSIEYLLNSIRILNNENSKLQNSLNDFKKLNDEKDTKITSHKQSISILNKNYLDFEKELSKYKIKMFNLTKSNKDLKSNIGENIHEINNLKNQLQICIADDKSNKSIIDSLYQKIDNLSGNLSESKLKNDQMENELNILRSKLENKLEDIINGNDKKFESVESLINKFNETMNVSSK
ncbi:hypothetical protein B5S29_g2660 [[Candida] boidinii]|nr:hypothetical protein B5S29_g2660 [[Candida] boidinii]